MSALLQTPIESEGLPRRRFTVAEVEEMTRVGVLGEDDRIELVGGELVPMSPKGSFHERLKIALAIHWARRLPPDLLVATETTFRLSPDTFLEPDFVFYYKATGWDSLAGGTALLVVELSDSSLAYDLGRKADVYAAFGIAELWVINAMTRGTRVHLDPQRHGYARVRDVREDDRLIPTCHPGLAVTLVDLDLH